MAKPKTDPPTPGASTPRLQKLLGQVATYYRRRFDAEPRAKKYLEGRGIKDRLALDRFGAGYCDGTLKDVLPFDDQVTTDLQTLGILKANGKELFAECVTFPLWSTAGACVGMYGRRLFNSDVKHLYLPGPRRGLVNWQAAKHVAQSALTPTGGTQRGMELFIAESILDALSLYVAGEVAVIPCYGTSGLTADHKELLARFQPKRIALCLDADDPGRMATPKIVGELQEAVKGAAVRIVQLPELTDANELLVERGAEALAALLREPQKVEPANLVAAATPITPPAASAVEKTTSGFALHRQGRTYEVKASTRQGTQLRVTLKAYAAKDPERFELSTIDVYSHRSRQWFASLCSGLLGIDAKEAEADLRALMQQLERDSNQPTEPSRIELTDAERHDAEQLLKSPKLIERIAEDLEAVGYTGERQNKLVCYLTAISRKLEEPLSVLIQSRSAAGKSALQDAILKLVPDEDTRHYSRLTDQALFYQGEGALKHKLLAIEEADGMWGAAYSLRAMQSQKRLTVAATGKDPLTGKMKTDEYTVEGPLAVMLTTTRTDFDPETMSRFIVLTVDESEQMTAQIHKTQREHDTLEGLLRRRTSEHVGIRHHNAQRLLEPLHVVNPYAPKLTFPTQSLKSRRDHKKYLGFIKSIAFLRQKQREVKEVTHQGERLRYVEADLKDIALANELAQVLRVGMNDLSPPAEKLVGLIQKMLTNGQAHRVKDTGVGTFTRKLLREYSGWSDWQLRRHLDELVGLELLYVRQAVLGKEYIYELSDERAPQWQAPQFRLTDVEALKHTLSISA